MAFVFQENLIFDVKRDQGKHWILVGAGGNGAYFVRDFMRQVKIQNDRLQEMGSSQRHNVTIIDADDIEAKNLIRQNFIRSDIGKFKSEVMAERYGKAFGTPINFVTEYIKDAAHLRRIADTQSGYPVFIGAVDNNKTRKIIYDAWKGYQGSFWIDAGNEEWGGQVVCGYNYPKKAEAKTPSNKPQVFRMPCLVDIYPEVFDAQDRLPDELSCAERAISAPQNVFTNLTAANYMLGFAYMILANDRNLNDGLKCHAIAFNTKNLMAGTTRYNTVENLQAEFDEAAHNATRVAHQAEAPVAVEPEVIAEPEAVAVAAGVADDAPF